MSQRSSDKTGIDNGGQPNVESTTRGDDKNIVGTGMEDHNGNVLARYATSLNDLCTPTKSESKGNDCSSGNSSSSNSSSGSTGGGDNNYNADYSADGGSDDNQSSDDTSGKMKPHPMMLDSSAMIAHHNHHHHNKHKGTTVGNSNKYDVNTSSDSTSSNDDDDDNYDNVRGKEKSRTSSCTKNSVVHNHGSNQEGIEQAQQQLSMLSTTTTNRSGTNDNGTNRASSGSMIDPKIDLSLVSHIPSSSLILPLHATATAALLQWNQTDPPSAPISTTTFNDRTATATVEKHNQASSILGNSNNNNNTLLSQHLSSQPMSNTRESGTGNFITTTPMLTVENYMHLMEAVRPFFHLQGMTYPQYVTHTSSSGNHMTKENDDPTADHMNNCNNPSSSEGFTSFFTTTTDESGGEKKPSAKGASTVQERSEAAEEVGTDDNLSMAVFARAKRKYIKPLTPEQTFDSTTTSSSSDASSSTPRDQQHLRGYPPAVESNNNNNNKIDNTKKMSRMVTDVSSSNPTTTSGSGSGDNGMNTTTGGSGSGTGSNQGSSGSGNDGKGSSEELAKEDSNSGGDGMNGSDGSSNNVANHRGNPITATLADESNDAQHHPLKHSSVEGRDGVNGTINESATREQKILVKKRKRIVMRREYEAQQRHMSSSESSGDSTEHFFHPGRPLTLDQVLIFSKIPRLVVLGTPPFLVVHKNAACCRLTGIDAHLLVGKPLSALLSIPSVCAEDGDIGEVETNDESKTVVPKTPTIPLASNADDIDTGKTPIVDVNRSMAATAFKNDETQTTIDRLIVTCGCDGNLNVVNVRTKLPSSTVGLDTQEKILCRIFVAPIVVSKDMVGGGGGPTDSHDQSKRARYQHPETDQLPPQHEQEKVIQMPLISHFVIQFDPCSNDQQSNSDSMESLSSANSIDEQSNKFAKVDLPAIASHSNETKSGNNIVDSNANQEQSISEGTDIDGSISVQSSDREPIVAIG